MAYIIQGENPNTGRTVYYKEFNASTDRASCASKTKAPRFSVEQAETIVRQLKARNDWGWEIVEVTA